jgi:hypothetical protein
VVPDFGRPAGTSGAVVGLVGSTVNGTIPDVAPGDHTLAAEISVQRDDQTVRLATKVQFEAITLHDPDHCEVLNDVECLLPYPSSRFLVPADNPPGTNGLSLELPDTGLPIQNGQQLSAAAYRAADGFSPTVQILMHFPRPPGAPDGDPAIDLEASGVARLLASTRTYDARSLDDDSPTILIDADTGERVLHFAELDAHAALPGKDPKRQVVFLRPARSLLPSHRYVVAVRGLVFGDGTPAEAEPAFAALRDGRPTQIAAIESRRQAFEEIFELLAGAGVGRDDLLLAFDFRVQSEANLSSQMLSMRDQGFAFVAAHAGEETFTVDNIEESDCSAPGATVGRIVEGTYQVPLFLDSDPAVNRPAPGYLTVDEIGTPTQSGITNPPYTISIPCAALAAGAAPRRFAVLGHGLLGRGRDFVHGVSGIGIDLIGGATDWWGLAADDIAGIPNDFLVGNIILKLDNFPALPDRMRQGQLNTLVLGRMMKNGVFNSNPAFQNADGTGVFAGPEEEGYYFGASLGGIMGLMFSALSPDVTNSNVDVPSINFSLLLQRATPFAQFDAALGATGITDPMQVALGISIVHELWVRGESAAVATHITADPYPDTNAKHILMTMAWLDQEVSNVGTEISARTLGLPQLEGSLLTGLVGIPDLPGPLDSALVVYDTGSFDLNNPAHAPFIPPLANLIPTANGCDPHGRRGFIPDSIEQLKNFFQPGGKIENFCNGICDAGDASEIPYGEPCDPLAP